MNTATQTVKSFGATWKAVDGTDGGEFTAVVSAFSNVDHGGDVVRPGAFAESLQAWADSGDVIPVIFDHQWHDLDSHIGYVVEALELAPGDSRLTEGVNRDLGGLWVRCALDADGKAVKVRRLLKGGRLREFSFVADILDAGWATVDGREVYELRKLGLREVGPTLAGMNPATSLTSIKSADLSAVKKAAHDALDAALSAIVPKQEVAIADNPNPPAASRPPGSVERAAAALKLLQM